MRAPTRHVLPEAEPSTTSIGDEGRPESPIHSWAADRAQCYATGRHLDDARSRLDATIAACARRQSQVDRAEIDDRGRVVPHRLSEVDSLQRLGHHLDSIAARFRAAMPRTEIRLAAGPVDLARADSLLRLDHALAGRTAALARRFDNPDLRHDFLADLEADLSDCERILDERALLLSRD